MKMICPMRRAIAEVLTQSCQGLLPTEHVTLGPPPLAEMRLMSVTPASAISARSFFCSIETWRALAKILRAAAYLQVRASLT